MHVLCDIRKKERKKERKREKKKERKVQGEILFRKTITNARMYRLHGLKIKLIFNPRKCGGGDIYKKNI